jgi:hypothetical protein
MVRHFRFHFCTQTHLLTPPFFKILLFFAFSQIYLIILHDINIEKEFYSSTSQRGMVQSSKRGCRNFSHFTTFIFSQHLIAQLKYFSISKQGAKKASQFS